MGFEAIFAKTNITAIKFHLEYLFAGVGDDLFVYKNLKFLHKLKIFEGNPIFGIGVNGNENFLSIFGGIHLKIWSTVENFAKISQFSQNSLQNWILASKWLQNDQIAAITMDNSLTLLNQKLEIVKKIQCPTKCIIYSAFICNGIFEELVLISGTVFNEILIWKPSRPSCEQNLKGHNGVIFCIDYCESTGRICSTSDDRSAILWQTEETEFAQKCRVWGHQSRVFKCKIARNCFVTCGEDGRINLWSFTGDLVKRIEAHSEPIWSLDENGEFFATGGADCALKIHSIVDGVNDEKLTVSPNGEKLKLIKIVEGQMVAFTENGSLYCSSHQTWRKLADFPDLKSYAIVSLSKCRNLLSLCGFSGQIHIYKSLKFLTSFTIDQNRRIYSFHWISPNFFIVCTENGHLTLYTIYRKRIEFVTNFSLPGKHKENSTTCALNLGKLLILIGDRRGSLYLFKIGSKHCLQTLKRVHSHLGVVNLIKDGENYASFGRDSYLKTFSLSRPNAPFLTQTSCDKLNFSWVAGLENGLLYGFSGRDFLCVDFNTKRKLFAINCGGGHRSFDFLVENNFADFHYIKNNTIHSVSCDLPKLSPTELIANFHTEINASTVIKLENSYCLITGGEDTTLRVYLIEDEITVNLYSFKTHLSSIRSICVRKFSDSEYYVFSAGGRQQIILWKLNFERNHQHPKFHLLFDYYEKTEVETRIMDVVSTVINDEILVLAGCSNGTIMLMKSISEQRLEIATNFSSQVKCITKLCIVESRSVLITATTDGVLNFWCLKEYRNFGRLKTHQSGINSISIVEQHDSLLMICTGGDDNLLCLQVVRIEEPDFSVVVLAKFCDATLHCAQITGVRIVDDLVFSASIDEKIVVRRWKWIGSETLKCEILDKYKCCIADIKGLNVCKNIENIYEIFVYGMGVQKIEYK